MLIYLICATILYSQPQTELTPNKGKNFFFKVSGLFHNQIQDLNQHGDDYEFLNLGISLHLGYRITDWLYVAAMTEFVFDGAKGEDAFEGDPLLASNAYTNYGFGVNFRHKLFYTGLTVGFGRISLSEKYGYDEIDDEKYKFINVPVGLIIHIYRFIELDISYNFQKKFLEGNKTITDIFLFSTGIRFVF